MKGIILSIFAAICLTISVNAATNVNTSLSPSKTFVKKETKEYATYSISYKINQTQDWCWVEWTVTVTWSDGTTSSYSGTTGSANGCGAAVSSALGTIGQILEAIL